MHSSEKRLIRGRIKRKAIGAAAVFTWGGVFWLAGEFLAEMNLAPRGFGLLMGLAFIIPWPHAWPGWGKAATAPATPKELRDIADRLEANPRQIREFTPTQIRYWADELESEQANGLNS